MESTNSQIRWEVHLMNKKRTFFDYQSTNGLIITSHKIRYYSCNFQIKKI